MANPKVVDDDHSEIRVEHDGREVQAWYYQSEQERREKMRFAWYFCDGWIAARQASA